MTKTIFFAAFTCMAGVAAWLLLHDISRPHHGVHCLEHIDQGIAECEDHLSLYEIDPSAYEEMILPQ